MFGISYIYFANHEKSSSMRVQAITSCHGALLAISYLIAFIIAVTENQNIIFLHCYTLFYLVIFLLILYSFIYYKGPKKVHFLQLILIPMLLIFGFHSMILVSTNSF